MKPRNLKPIPELWFLVYAGTSCDGRGTPIFSYRTTDIDVAIKALKEVYRSPHNIGKVMIITDTAETVATLETLKNLKSRMKP